MSGTWTECSYLWLEEKRWKVKVSSSSSLAVTVMLLIWPGMTFRMSSTCQGRWLSCTMLVIASTESLCLSKTSLSEEEKNSFLIKLKTHICIYLFLFKLSKLVILFLNVLSACLIKCLILWLHRRQIIVGSALLFVDDSTIVSFFGLSVGLSDNDQSGLRTPWPACTAVNTAGEPREEGGGVGCNHFLPPSLLDCRLEQCVAHCVSWPNHSKNSCP